MSISINILQIFNKLTILVYTSDSTKSGLLESVAELQ